MRPEFRVICILALAVPAGALQGQEVGKNIIAAAALPDAPSLAVSASRAGDLVAARNCGNSAHNREEAACTLSKSKCCYSRLNLGGKLEYFADHSFGPGVFIGSLFTAGPEMASPPAHYPREWRQGVRAFGRLYGDALAFQTTAQTGKFLTGAVFHEDPRYYRSTSHNPLLRTMHAIVFTAFDKSDSGHTTVALSNLGGAASAGFVGNAYLPRGYNDTSHAVTRTGIAFGSFTLTNLASEFSPELRRMGRGLHLPEFMFSGQTEK